MGQGKRCCGRARALGKGKVYTGKSIEDVLAAENVLPDFSWSKAENVGAEIPYSLPAGDSDHDLVFIHRTMGIAKFTLPPRRSITAST